MYCNYCHPDFFVVYGNCGNCGKKCNPPLFDQKGEMSILDYEEIRNNWLSDLPSISIQQEIMERKNKE